MNNKSLSFRRKIKLFASNKKTKEVVVVQTVTVFIAYIIYLTLDFFSAIVFTIPALLIEMLLFRILWTYRRNPHKKNQLWYAVKTKIFNIIMATLTMFALVGINTITVRLFGVHTLVPAFLGFIALFLGHIKYKIYTKQVSRE